MNDAQIAAICGWLLHNSMKVRILHKGAVEFCKK